MRYYIDTCIWIDYYENRQDKFRPLGEWALRLLRRIVEEDSLVVYSTILIKELLKAGYNQQKIKEILSIIKSENLVKLKFTVHQNNEAKKIVKERKLPRGDVLHAIFSRDSRSILISRDKHFQSLIDICQCYRPEELI